jgi:hypothetical protein
MAKMCDDELSDDDDDDDMISTFKCRPAYAQWRRLILVAKCVSVFKKNNGIERITNEVNYWDQVV